MQLYKMKRLDIVVETSQREKVIDIIRKSGVTGYTMYGDVNGEGMRESRDDIGFGYTNKNVAIFVIGPEDLIRELVQEMSKLFENHAGILFLSDVEVSRQGLFLRRVIERVVRRFKGKGV